MPLLADLHLHLRHFRSQEPNLLVFALADAGEGSILLGKYFQFEAELPDFAVLLLDGVPQVADDLLLAAARPEKQALLDFVQLVSQEGVFLPQQLVFALHPAPHALRRTVHLRDGAVETITAAHLALPLFVGPGLGIALNAHHQMLESGPHGLGFARLQTRVADGGGMIGLGRELLPFYWGNHLLARPDLRRLVIAQAPFGDGEAVGLVLDGGVFVGRLRLGTGTLFPREVRPFDI